MSGWATCASSGRRGRSSASRRRWSDFASTVTALVQQGQRKVLIDLAPVTYLDSATIGCLMDLYRQITGAGGRVKLSGVQKRVETMLTMTGTQNFIEVHPDAESALASFGA